MFIFSHFVLRLEHKSLSLDWQRQALNLMLEFCTRFCSFQSMTSSFDLLILLLEFLCSSTPLQIIGNPSMPSVAFKFFFLSAPCVITLLSYRCLARSLFNFHLFSIDCLFSLRQYSVESVRLISLKNMSIQIISILQSTNLQMGESCGGFASFRSWLPVIFTKGYFALALNDQTINYQAVCDLTYIMPPEAGL